MSSRSKKRGTASSSSISSSAAAAADSTPDMGASKGLMPVIAIDKLSKHFDEITTEKTASLLKIGGLTVIIPASVYAILNVMYPIIFENLPEIARIIGITLPTEILGIVASTAFVEFVILGLLSSVLGRVVASNVVPWFLNRLRIDPATKAILTDQMKAAGEYAGMPSAKAWELLTFISSKLPQESKDIITNIATAAASQTVKSAAGAASSSKAAAEEKIEKLSSYVSEFVLPGATERQNLLDLRRAIYLWTLTFPFYDTPKMKKASNYLEGQIITLIGHLEAKGITEDAIEHMLENGLPGAVGFAADVKSSISSKTEDVTAGIRTVLANFTDQVKDSIIGMLYGSLKGGVTTRSIAQKLSNERNSVLSRVENMIHYLEKGNIKPPSSSPDFMPRLLPTAEIRSELLKGTVGTLVKALQMLDRGEKPADIISKLNLDEEEADVIKNAITTQKRSREEPDDEDPSPSAPFMEEPSAQRVKQTQDGLGKHTRKHNKTHKKSANSRRRSAPHNRRHVSNSSGKRTHDRRRTNRRTMKRTKK